MFIELLDKYLTENWKKSWKFISLWVLLIIGLSPELYNLAIQYKIVEPGSIPTFFNDLIKTLAFLGAAGRLLNQKAIAQGIWPSKTSRSM